MKWLKRLRAYRKYLERRIRIGAPLIIAAACSPKTNQPSLPHFEQISVRDTSQNGLSGNSFASSSGTFSTQSVPTAEAYWKDLIEHWKDLTDRAPKGKGRAVPSSFQIFTDLKFKKIAFGDPKDNRLGSHYWEVQGRQIPSKIPQILYATSGESGVTERGGKTKFLPPRLSVFLGMVKQMNDDGKLWFWQAPSLKYLNTEAGQLERRNQALVSTAETSLPGAFTAKSGPLETAELYQKLLKSVGISKLWYPFNQDLSEICQEVPLFTSMDWNERTADLRTSLTILETVWHDEPASDIPPTPLETAERKIRDNFYRFAIAQRVIAQIVTLKGIVASPRLNAQGLIEMPELKDDAADRAEDRAGLIEAQNDDGTWQSVVVTGDWIKDALTKPHTQRFRPTGVKSLAEIQFFLRYLHELSSHKSYALWKEYLDRDLLRLGMGLSVAQIKSIRDNDIKLNPADPLHIELSENDPNTFAEMLKTMAERLAVFEGVDTAPAEVVAQIFSQSERQQMATDLRLNLTGFILEARRRQEEGNSSARLDMTLQDVGTQIRNDYLSTP